MAVTVLKNAYICFHFLGTAKSSICVYSHIVAITNSMEHSPSETSSHSTTQEILHLLGKLKVHYHVHESQSLVPILSQMNPVHKFPPYFPKTHSNIFSSTPRSSKWSLPFRFSDQNLVFVSHLSHAAIEQWNDKHPMLSTVVFHSKTSH
jgi:hypothetical protein